MRVNTMLKDREKKDPTSSYYLIAIILGVVVGVFLTISFKVLGILFLVLLRLTIKYWWAALLIVLAFLYFRKKKSKKEK